MHKKTLVIALLFALIVSAIPNALVKAQGVPNPERFTDATIGNAETCDPAWAYDTASGELIFNVYEPLLTFDNDKVDAFVSMVSDWWPGYGTTVGNAIIPAEPDPAAPSYTVETWYFRIKDNVPWQDSAYGIVTAADAEYSIERGMVMDHGGGPQWMFLEPLLMTMCTRDFNIGVPGAPGPDAALVGHMIDDAVQSGYRTDLGPPGNYVWFNLKQAYAAFQQILSQSWGCIMNKEWVMDEHPSDWPGFGVTGYQNWVDYNDPAVPGPQMLPAPSMMGSGPYMMDYWDTDPDVGWYHLVYFPLYWGGWSPHPHVHEVIIKSVLDDTTRLALFTSENAEDQVDTCYVPRQLSSTLYGEPGIRFLKGLDSMAGDGMFFAIDPDEASIYLPTMGGVVKHDLFADRHLRLAFSYCVNMTSYILATLLGEGFALGNPIISGTRYFNGSKPIYDQDLTRARQEFQLAWGGQVWTQGFTAIVTANKGSKTREPFVNILKNVIETQIGFPSTVVIQPMFVAWSVYLPALYTKQLCAFVIGWQADFPDPHNWVMPFEHTRGDFSQYQEINYGQDPGSMNWYHNTYGPLPYHNYKGDLVTALSNDYVDGLIERGIQIPDSDPLRQRLYEELMDIFYAECFTKMTIQALGRHWERDWLQGWFYNPIRPGYYAYDLWKSDACTYDVASTMRVEGMGDLIFDVHTYGTGWPIQYVYENITVEIADSAGFTVNFLDGATGIVHVTYSGGRTRIQVDAWAFVRYCVPTDVVRINIVCTNHLRMMEEEVGFYGPVPPPIPPPPDHPPGKGWIRTEHMDQIPDAHPADNSLHMERIGGDFNVDGSVDGSDFFILLQNWGFSPPNDPRADPNCDGTVDGSDFFILLQDWGKTS